MKCCWEFIIVFVLLEKWYNWLFWSYLSSVLDVLKDVLLGKKFIMRPTRKMTNFPNKIIIISYQFRGELINDCNLEFWNELDYQLLSVIGGNISSLNEISTILLLLSFLSFWLAPYGVIMSEFNSTDAKSRCWHSY